MTVASPGFLGRRHERGQIWFWFKPLHIPPTTRRLSLAEFSSSTFSTFSCLRPPLSAGERAAHLGILQAWTAGNFERCFCLLLLLFLVFLTVPFWRRGCGEGAVRMRNTVLQLCLWSAYCYFATGDPAPRGPEGRLQGNVHLFLLPPPQFLFWPRCPLSCPPFFLNPAASSLLSACAVHSLLLISLAVHLFFGASDQGIPEPAAAGCARPRSVRLHPFAVNMHPYRCCPVSRVGCQQLFNLALLFEPAGFRGKKVVRKSSVIWRSSFNLG